MDGYDAFYTELKAKVELFVKEKVCKECSRIHLSTLFQKEQSTCYMGEFVIPSNYIQIWMRYFLVTTCSFDMVCRWLYTHCTEVAEDIDAFLFISCVLRKSRLLGATTRIRIREAMDAKKKYPRFTTSDFYAISHESAFSIFYYGELSSEVLCMEYHERGYARLDELEEEWYMDTQEYTGYIQWMPKEMLEDVMRMVA